MTTPFPTIDPTNSTTTTPASTEPPTTFTTATSDVPPTSTPPITTTITTDTTTTTIPITTTTTTTIPTSSTTVVTTPTTIISTTTVTTVVTTPTPTTGPVTSSTTLVTVTSQIDPPTSSSSSASSTQTTSSASPTILPSNGRSNGGLGSSGTIAIAVIIPVVVVALLLVLGFFLWRKRKARKAAEEQRKDEMAEYGFNPNNDPTLFPVAGAYTDGHSEAADDNSGYRGWGTTNSNMRKPSTTMGSNSRAGAMGVGMSESGSQPGGYGYSPPQTNGATEAHASDPLMGGGEEHIDGIAALGATGAAGAAGARNNRVSQAELSRGISNASSSYSKGGPQSEVSAEVPYTSPQYHEDSSYNAYNDGHASHSPYGDGTYSNDQPVIRDVSARRNTKIERAPTFPQTQGGIAQNF